jgi:predicted esterase
MKELIIFLLLLIAVLQTSEAHAAANRSGCSVDEGVLFDKVDCPYQTLRVKGPILTRTVKYGIPQGRAPKDGWPTVIIYQGSFFPVEFSRRSFLPFGGYNEILLIKNLMDHGFAVIAPPATEKIAWMTNIVGINYDRSEDYYFVAEMLQRMNAGDFGNLDMSNLFATGISSGGYHTSRMAVSFPGVFKALAIESASYATCGGPLCFIPQSLPVDHPPTLFLHGALDAVVPVNTMLSYRARLQDAGVPTEIHVDTLATHQWLDEAPELITDWFLKYR